MIITSASKCNVTTKIYNSVLKLLREFNESEEPLTGQEFIEQKLALDCTQLDDDVIQIFILLVHHKEFLNVVKSNLIAYFSIRNHNEPKIIMLLFFIVFICSSDKEDEMLEIFKHINCSIRKNILEYFLDDNNLIATAVVGCKIFEDEYVMTQIIYPLLNKRQLFLKFQEFLANEEANRYPKKPLTIPDHLHIFERTKRVPAVPLNTPVENMGFRARSIPKSLFVQSSVDKKLMGEHERNKTRAQKLLEEAKSLNANYCKVHDKSRMVFEEVSSGPVFKAKKAPTRHDVKIRDNVATVLREGKLCIKEQEREIKQIEYILRGGSDWRKYQELEENSRKLEYQQHLQDVERKHLEGLITFEESILAKKKLLENNKEKFKIFMEERDEFLNMLEEWRSCEFEKIQKLVQKGHEIERNARESERRFRKDRREYVGRLKDESLELRQKMCDKQKTDLANKVALIREIKSLHQLRMMNNAKESANLTTLCQMSVAELQQKLETMRINMRRQLEQKRRCIMLRKAKQRQMIENVKHFIAQTRMSKPKSVPNRPTTKLDRTPDLDRLRAHLENARQLRKSST